MKEMLTPNLIEKENEQELKNGFLNFLKNNPNNFSFWFPKIKDCGIAVPKTVIVTVPDDIIEAFFLERPEDGQLIRDFIHEKVMPAINDMPGLPFIKNGTFSDKFTFSKCCPPDKKEETIFDSIRCIQYDSLCFDTGGNAEIVIRERIPSPEDMPRIYGGMPLNCEVRLFYDFSTRRSLYAVNYWDKDYCSERIHDNEADGEAYDKRYPQLLAEYGDHVKDVKAIAEDKLKTVQGLKGIWSVDFLIDTTGKIWLIDMAVGHQSAYYDPVKISIAEELPVKK